MKVQAWSDPTSLEPKVMEVVNAVGGRESGNGIVSGDVPLPHSQLAGREALAHVLQALDKTLLLPMSSKT